MFLIAKELSPGIGQWPIYSSILLRSGQSVVILQARPKHKFSPLATLSSHWYSEALVEESFFQEIGGEISTHSLNAHSTPFLLQVTGDSSSSLAAIV